MPKRVGYIYGRMNNPDFIRHCIHIGTKESKKKRRKDVQAVLADVDGHVAKMQEIVESRSFAPVQPRHRTVYDPSSQKYRNTSSVPFFPDGLMHIMIVQAMMDVLMRGMSHWSCSSVPGRGNKRIRKRIHRAMKSDPKGTRYAAEMDVKSYYPSIPVEKLMRAFERKIKDRDFLLLLAMALTCHPDSLAHALEQGFSWWHIAHGKCGIEIGFYVCQWSANYYLETVDRLATSCQGVKYIARNMDNLTILGPNKKQLHKARTAISKHMSEKLGLTMKENWQVYRTTFTAPVARRHSLLDEKTRRRQRPRMVSAVGYRYSHTHTILRKRNFLRLTRKCRKVQKRFAAGKPITFQQASGLLSRIGQLKHCNSYSIRKKYVDPIKIKKLKEVVRNESKRRQRSQQRLYGGSAA